MAQHTEFKIAYDGDALRNHLMDVRDLAPALLSVAQLFDEANRVLNDNRASVGLQIKAQEAGSYEVVLHLYQSVSSQLVVMLNSSSVTAVNNLLGLTAGAGTAGTGLFWLVKKLHGKTPEKITVQRDTVQIEHNRETFDIPLKLLRLYKDVAVRTAAEQVLKPLSQDGIDKFQIKSKKHVLVTVDKEETRYFVLPELPEEQLNVSQHEEVYSIVSLAFKDDNKWRLNSAGTTISATIVDREFL